MRRAIYLIVFLCLIFPEVGWSQPFWSVGPKIGYTFGDNGGFTGGFEVSYFPHQEEWKPLWGYTFDFTFWKDHRSFHLGVEFAEAFGINAGPTLFYSKRVFNMGLSAIPWVGAFIFPYYEFAWPFGQTPFQSVGGYLKFPIGLKSYGDGDFN